MERAGRPCYRALMLFRLLIPALGGLLHPAAVADPNLSTPTPQAISGNVPFEKSVAELTGSAKAGSADFEMELHAWEAEVARPIPWQPLSPATLTARHGTTPVALE